MKDNKITRRQALTIAAGGVAALGGIAAVGGIAATEAAPDPSSEEPTALRLDDGDQQLTMRVTFSAGPDKGAS
jgi:hypothetical protein